MTLNKINYWDKIKRVDNAERLFNVVFAEDNGHFNFVAVNTNCSVELHSFTRLITRSEFVSLTFNTLYLDLNNRKLIFRPSIIPSYSFEFDVIDSNMKSLARELKDTRDTLGFLTIQTIQLDPCHYEAGNYHDTLDSLLYHD